MKGAGLGDRFLGHVERCRVLLHLVDGTGDDPAEAYRVIREELAAYGHGLDEKPEVVALSKADALTPGGADGEGQGAGQGRRAEAADPLRRLRRGRRAGAPDARPRDRRRGFCRPQRGAGRDRGGVAAVSGLQCKPAESYVAST